MTVVVDRRLLGIRVDQGGRPLERTQVRCADDVPVSSYPAC